MKNEYNKNLMTTSPTLLTPKCWQRKVLTWYAQHGRHDLPWQRHKTAYRVWVSEVMLQQTQVKTVIPYFKRFMRRFPSLKALALASIDEVLDLWTGLGYYSRARHLHRTAQILFETYHGRFPQALTALCQLPGIGRSTAGAILAIAFEQATPILDGNVKRVLVRSHGIHGWPESPTINKKLWELSTFYMPQQHCADYTQAMMDLGATVCTRSQANCDKCPLQSKCIAYHSQQVSALPTPKPRTAKPERACQLLLLSNNNGHLLLEQRPPVGIWGGLWSFPQCDAQDNVAQWCRKHWGFAIKEIVRWKPLRHSFSHFHLTIQPVLATLKPNGTQLMDAGTHCWYDVSAQAPGGFAAPVKQLLTRYAAYLAGEPR